jgi:hypothetical protein
MTTVMYHTEQLPTLRIGRWLQLEELYRTICETGMGLIALSSIILFTLIQSFTSLEEREQCQYPESALKKIQT